VSPFLAIIGISVLGTWGLASAGIIAGGIILLVDPGNQPVASDPVLGGIILLIVGIVSLVAMLATTLGPLLGVDPPLPLPAKKIVPAAKLTKWAKAGQLRDFPDGTPKEVRVLSKRVVVIREGDTAYAMNGLCSHARLPFGGLPPFVKAEPIADGCIMCPFHGARFEVATGKVVRQPFDSRFNTDHPFLGGFQSKLFGALSKIPAPPGAPKPGVTAEDAQTYPVRIEDGEVMVALPE
jgi:nitrite reductase/ring-hydroxylating ferredoxin subunit